MQLQLGLCWPLTPALVPRTAAALTTRSVPLLKKVLYEWGGGAGRIISFREGWTTSSASSPAILDCMYDQKPSPGHRSWYFLHLCLVSVKTFCSPIPSFPTSLSSTLS